MKITKMDSSELIRLFQLEVNENRLLNKDFIYFDRREARKETIFVALSDDEQEIMGLAGYQKSPIAEEENIFWFNYVTVAPDFRRQNIAEKLVESAMHDLSNKNESAILKLSYTDTGEVLRELMERVARDFGVELWHKKLHEFNYTKQSR